MLTVQSTNSLESQRWDNGCSYVNVLGASHIFLRCNSVGYTELLVLIDSDIEMLQPSQPESHGEVRKWAVVHLHFCSLPVQATK